MITSAITALRILSKKSKNPKPYIKALKAMLQRYGIGVVGW